MIISLPDKRYNIPIISFLLIFFFALRAPASPLGPDGRYIPPGHFNTADPVKTTPRREGSRLYFTPACPIIAENFNEAADVNGATSDPSSVGWYLDASNVPNAVYFAIKSHRIKAQTLGGEGVWYSQVYNISGYTGIQVDAKISSEGSFTSSEYAHLFYKLDGGPETSFGSYTGAFGTPLVTSGQMTGHTVQIVIRLYNVSAGNNDYYIEQYDVFKETGPCTVSGIPVSASASNSGVLTCTNPSTTLTASTTATGTTTYSWTGPNSFSATGASVTATTAGIYTVTGTNPAGTGTATVNVTSNTAAPGGLTATASGQITCSTPSVTLTGSSSLSGVTFAWTGPNNFTATGATATATAAGTYTLTATYPPTGCWSSVTVNVTSNTTAPAGVTIAAANNVTQLTCSTNFTTLSGSSTTSGVTYSWSGPNSFTATSSAVNVFNPGTYTLTATNPASGCTSTASIAITQNVTSPAGATISPNVAALTCTNPSVTLTGSSTTSGVSYAWSGPNSFTATGTTATAVSAGQYILTVTNPVNGCTSTTTATVSQNFTPPAGVTAINNGPQTCYNSNVILTGSSTTSGTTFAWTGPNGFAATGATATLPIGPEGGTYTLTATNPATGCTATTTTVVAQDINAPTGVSVSSNTSSTVLNCINPSITLTASSDVSGATYAWRVGPTGSTIGTGAALSVSQPNQYDVLVTNPANGCAFLGGATVTQNLTVPASAAVTTIPANAVLTCANTSVALTGTSSDNAASYSWTGPNGFTSSSASASTTTPGAYTLTATDNASGCTATASVNVTQNVAVPAGLAIATNTGATVLNCYNPQLSLTGSSTTSGASFAWSGPNSFISTSNPASISTPGTYMLTATGANGCTATAASTITVDTATPAAITTSSVPANATLTCSSPNVVLTGNSSTSGVTYAWTGPGNFTSSGAVATVATPGSYVVTVTKTSNGCSSAATASAVTQNIIVPVGVTANASNTLSCLNPNVTITGNSTTTGATYAWTGPAGFTSSAKVATATVGGPYTLMVTNPANGCTATKSLTVIADTASPAGVTATNSGPLTCDITTVTLTGNSTTSNVSYIWSGPNGFFDPEQVSTAATDSGTYVLTVSSNTNGCFTTASTYVAQDLSACSSFTTRALTTGKANALPGGAADSLTTTPFTCKVYPNPISKVAYIEFKSPTASQVSVELYNAIGVREQVLFQNAVEANQSYRLTLPPGGLAAGIHYCVIRVDNKVYTSKMLVVH